MLCDHIHRFSVCVVPFLFTHSRPKETTRYCPRYTGDENAREWSAVSHLYRFLTWSNYFDFLSAILDLTCWLKKVRGNFPGQISALTHTIQPEYVSNIILIMVMFSFPCFRTNHNVRRLVEKFACTVDAANGASDGKPSDTRGTWFDRMEILLEQWNHCWET